MTSFNGTEHYSKVVKELSNLSDIELKNERERYLQAEKELFKQGNLDVERLRKIMNYRSACEHHLVKRGI